MDLMDELDEEEDDEDEDSEDEEDTDDEEMCGCQVATSYHSTRVSHKSSYSSW